MLVELAELLCHIPLHLDAPPLSPSFLRPRQSSREHNSDGGS